MAQQLAHPCVVHVGGTADPALNNVGLDCSGNFVVSDGDGVIAQILPAVTQGQHGSGTDLDVLVSGQIVAVQVCGFLGGAHADEALQAEAHPADTVTATDLLHHLTNEGIGSKQDRCLIIAQCVVGQVSDTQTGVHGVGSGDLSAVDRAHHHFLIDGLVAAQLAAGEILHGDAALGLLSDQSAQIVVQAGSNVLSGSVRCQAQVDGVLRGVISGAASSVRAATVTATATSQQGQCHDRSHDQSNQSFLHYKNPP